MRRSRNKLTPITLTRVSEHREKQLVALARYRYLDTHHIFLLTGWDNSNAHNGLRELSDAGLVLRLPNKLFNRDTLKDAQVYEITARGYDYLEQNDLVPPSVTWLHGGHHGLPDHNLKLCLFLASLEVAFTKAGIRFISWDEIYATIAPDAKKLTSPFRFRTNIKINTLGTEPKYYELVPDAIFSVLYPDGSYHLFFVEVDLTAHGKTEYARKCEGYKEIVYKGAYKRRFVMEQDASVLTATNSAIRQKNMAALVTDDIFLFKTFPEYGDLKTTPQPNHAILDGWTRAKRSPLNLKESEVI